LAKEVKDLRERSEFVFQSLLDQLNRLEERIRKFDAGS
jgi:hypothetical protein